MAATGTIVFAASPNMPVADNPTLIASMKHANDNKQRGMTTNVNHGTNSRLTARLTNEVPEKKIA
ncbi:hypothetical protein TUM4445_14460 [Shewanella sp. MBTL60-112-B2]|nr:hypothetical protein TUM4444_08480 [Shewanella sp. MBTL60-112-B1]GIU30743.1 hypothetical protein TUM4445_14460 [Shewanella sp. MBTL60-112-B2]